MSSLRVTFAALVAMLALDASAWWESQVVTNDYGYVSRSYIQDGLTSMWDGIENVGFMSHDNSSETWRDIIGGKDMKLAGSAKFNDTSMVTTNSSLGYANYSGTVFGNQGTLEIIFSGASSSSYNTIFTRTDDAFSIYTGGWTWKGPSTRPMLSSVIYKPIVATWDSSSSTLKYQDGSASSNGSGYTGGGSATWSICGTDSSHLFYGRMFCVRIYSRILNSAELEHNRELDEYRFFDGETPSFPTYKLVTTNRVYHANPPQTAYDAASPWNAPERTRLGGDARTLRPSAIIKEN